MSPVAPIGRLRLQYGRSIAPHPQLGGAAFRRDLIVALGLHPAVTAAPVVSRRSCPTFPCRSGQWTVVRALYEHSAGLPDEHSAGLPEQRNAPHSTEYGAFREGMDQAEALESLLLSTRNSSAATAAPTSGATM